MPSAEARKSCNGKNSGTMFRKITSLKYVKAVPLGNARVKGETKYSSYSFFTSALGRGEWLALHPGRALPLVPIR
jgi:hypothetical protein